MLKLITKVCFKLFTKLLTIKSQTRTHTLYKIVYCNMKMNQKILKFISNPTIELPALIKVEEEEKGVSLTLI